MDNLYFSAHVGHIQQGADHFLQGAEHPLINKVSEYLLGGDQHLARSKAAGLSCPDSPHSNKLEPVVAVLANVFIAHTQQCCSHSWAH